jgi:hypothetical protein
MRTRMALLTAAAAVGLLAMPEGALAQRAGGTFVADNVLWLPDVFAALSATNKLAVQNEWRAEDAIFKKVQRALTRQDFSTLSRSELGRILSLSNLGVADRDLTPDDLAGTGPFAYAGLDRMVGVGVNGASSFRVDLSQNFLPTLLVPTVSGGNITGYTPLDDVYSIAGVRRGKGGAKLATNGINFNPSTGELQVTLKKPFADKQFVNLIIELDDGSSPSKGKKRARAAAPSFQVTFANMTLPLASEPIQVNGTFSGGTVTSQAQDIEDQVTADRPDNRHFVVAVENATGGINLATGAITDNNTTYRAVVTNGVLFKKFNVEVASSS